MLRNHLCSELRLSADRSYHDFASRLIPGETRMLGVRLPVLRTIARQYSRRHWRELLDTPAAPDASFEELLLRAMLPAYAADTTLPERLRYLQQEQPNLNNWSLCDSACATCHFVKQHREEVAPWLETFLTSTEEFTSRFGVVMLNNYYTRDTAWADWVMHTLPNIKAQGYYADMAVAWCACTLLCRFPERAETMLSPSYLSPPLHKLLCKKLRESRIRIHISPQNLPDK